VGFDIKSLIRVGAGGVSTRFPFPLCDMYLAWIGDANTLRNKISKKNDEIDACIKDIQADIETTQNIVKTIGYLDDIIKIAADLVP
jgi:hypothetical protein